MIIRKISIGTDYKNAMTYIVGQKILNDTHEIHIIKHDKTATLIQIWIENTQKEVMLWKSYNNSVPMSIEYNINY